MSIGLHYSSGYNSALAGVLPDTHLFDIAKYGHALALVESRLGAERVAPHLHTVTEEVSYTELCLIHSERYLQTLETPSVVARALEYPPVEQLPAELIDAEILRPMRLAVNGTIAAAREAVMHNTLAFNLAGGYHHASRDRGEGFCLYGDAYLSIVRLRQEGLLGAQDPVLYIDLDAHQGNGMARLCAEHQDEQIVLLDLFNTEIYPQDRIAQQRVDRAVPLISGTTDRTYLGLLRAHLRRAVASVQPRFALYNAGTDIVAGDPLGGLNMSEEGVRERDRFVLQTLRAAGIPVAVVLGGGYTPQSHQLIANMLCDALMERGEADWAGGSCG
jgi:histone deacetylase 11